MVCKFSKIFQSLKPYQTTSMTVCYLIIYNICWSFLNQIRKIPIKNEEDDDEGHPPGENEEANSDEQSESV